jgi:hypothetical protein
MGLGSFKTKDDAKGVRVHVDGDFYVYVRRSDNVDYQRELNALGRNRRERRRKKEDDGDLMQALLENATNPEMKEARRALAAKYILVGWEGLVDDFGDFGDKGATLPYSPELALRIMTHPRYSDFYQAVMEMSQDKALFREELIREDQGN